MYARPRHTDRQADRQTNVMTTARRFVLTNASCAKNYLHTKFRQVIYFNRPLIYYYFRVLKTNGRHIGILLPVSTLMCVVIGIWFCVRVPNFIWIGPSAAELWRRSDFQDGGRQPCWICFGVMVDHPRSVSDGPCLAFKCRLERIYSFGYSPIFVPRPPLKNVAGPILYSGLSVREWMNEWVSEWVCASRKPCEHLTNQWKEFQTILATGVLGFVDVLTSFHDQRSKVKVTAVKVTEGNDRKTLWTPYLTNQWREFNPVLVTYVLWS